MVPQGKVSSLPKWRDSKFLPQVERWHHVATFCHKAAFFFYFTLWRGGTKGCIFLFTLRRCHEAIPHHKGRDGCIGTFLHKWRWSAMVHFLIPLLRAEVVNHGVRVTRVSNMVLINIFSFPPLMHTQVEMMYHGVTLFFFLPSRQWMCQDKATQG